MASWDWALMGSGRRGPSGQADHNMGRDLGVNGHLKGKANLSIEPVSSPQSTVQLQQGFRAIRQTRTFSGRVCSRYSLTTASLTFAIFRPLVYEISKTGSELCRRLSC